MDRVDLESLTDLAELEYANRLFGMHARETKALAMLATRMRLTHHSVTVDSTAGQSLERRARVVHRPWEGDGDAEPA